jgi:ribonuclease PH
MNKKRIDGRSFDSLRKVEIKRNYSKYAEGSCLIEMGNTKVICTATVDKNVPLFLRNSGSGWVKAEYGMLPRSTHTRNMREKISGRNMEIQRLIGRSLRSVVDLRKLGERTVWIDCDVVQADGGTRTASIVGGFVALVDCMCKLYKDAIVITFPITDFLGATSVGILQGTHVLDLNYQEDTEVDVDMNVVMKSSGEFVEVQGTAERGSFSGDDLNTLLDLAKKGINEIIDLERNILKDIQPLLI